jgi:hypothetical protein
MTYDEGKSEASVSRKQMISLREPLESSSHPEYCHILPKVSMTLYKIHTTRTSVCRIFNWYNICELAHVFLRCVRRRSEKIEWVK